MITNNNINEIRKINEIKDIYENSLFHHIPILRDKTIELLLNSIDKYNCHTCLEIGTGVGYSTSILAIVKNMNIISIEKSEERFLIAKNNLKAIKNIKLLNIDIFEYLPNETFDLIILDGPKSHQIELIERLSQYLNPNGIIFIDNLFLNAFKSKIKLTNNQKKIINEIEKLNNYLNNYSKERCEIYNIEDGVAIIKL